MTGARAALWGIGWDYGAKKWQMQELDADAAAVHRPATIDEDGYVLATNCYCFYLDDKGPIANPVGALWRVMPADKVQPGMEVGEG